MRTALIVVDMQYDFLPGGSLPVPGGDEIIPGICARIRDPRYKLVVTTQDWHPHNSAHFKDWPAHCIAGTFGAQIEARIQQALIGRPVYHILKGQWWNEDGYSGFSSHNMDYALKTFEIEAVDVCGLAENYCVKRTADDAVTHGYSTSILSDLTRPVGK